MTRADIPLIGVDGGGTSCRAALIWPDGRRFEGRGGSANVSDFDRALDAITATLGALARDAGAGQADLAGAALHLGLAGVTGPAMAARVREALAPRLSFGRISVSGDQTTTIAGALGEMDGAVAGIGTGSFVGRQSAGRIRSLGGHGFLLGDQASGAWLGQRLLQELMLADDGIVAHSDLTRSLLADHGNDRADLIAFAIAARPADFGRLAPRIVGAARDGDPVAARLMREGADYIVAALAALGWAAAEPLCLTGGLGPAFRDWLPEPVAARVLPPRGSALDGALALAARGGQAP
jgi:glucosamine kinase